MIAPWSSQQAAFLKGPNYKNIWELAHIWANKPLSEGSAEIGPDVYEIIMQLLLGHRRKKLMLRKRTGHYVDYDDMFLGPTLFNLNRARVRILHMTDSGDFDIEYLQKLFVFRADLIQLCESDFINPPSIWSRDDLEINEDDDEDSEEPDKRQWTIERDKHRAQAIAKVLWRLEPEFFPTHIVESKTMKECGPLKTRADKTIRRWIAEVDPRAEQRSTGRNPNRKYKIDI